MGFGGAAGRIDFGDNFVGIAGAACFVGADDVGAAATIDAAPHKATAASDYSDAEDRSAYYCYY